jgi:hypothetical protein
MDPPFSLSGVSEPDFDSGTLCKETVYELGQNEAIYGCGTNFK